MTQTEIFDNSSTICAVSTPAGCGGLAVIRVSGPKAIEIVGKVWRGKSPASFASHTAHLGEIVDPQHDGETIDQCVATIFRAPNSFTGEDVIELSVHGSRWIQREVLSLLVSQGCRIALPGEFTRRALMNQRLDLAQAEGVADTIAASSRAAHHLAQQQLSGGYSAKINSLRDKLIELASLLELELDFSEEDVEFADRGRLRSLATEIEGLLARLLRSYSSGAAIKDGIPVAIVGPTNAGKSSLLNALLDSDRAIVSDIPGTTRDTIEETVEIGDYLFRFIDTAGLRDTSDPIERLGIERSRQAIARARIIIAVIDPTASVPGLDTLAEATASLHEDASVIAFINKSDICDPTATKKLITGKLDRPQISSDSAQKEPGTRFQIISGSAKNETGEKIQIISGSAKNGQIGQLINALTSTVATNVPGETDDLILTNARHADAISHALSDIRDTIVSLDQGVPPEFTAQSLRQAISHLSSITSPITPQTLLNNIFKNFCIGK